jgi:type III secretion protein Q
MNRAAPFAKAPVRLRRIDATGLAQSRLTRSYRARCPLPGGDEAELLMRLDTHSPARADDCLPLSTRFGLAVAFDYGALLLACCGVDVDGAPAPGVRIALARYGFAALPPALQTALGEPTVCAALSDAMLREATIGLHLQLRSPSIRLTMRLRITSTGMHALLDSGAWRRVDAPPSLPTWLTDTRAALPVIVGATTLPLADYRALTCGDVVRVEATRFDVTGRAILRFAGRRLHLRWLDAQQCFEVQAMSDDTPFPDRAIDDTAASATASIEPSAIPVRLSFSLGVLSLTVGKISEICAGSLLPLDRGLPPQVKIEANGLPIGAGELVDLEGKLAVEITQWPHDGAAPPKS